MVTLTLNLILRVILINATLAEERPETEAAGNEKKSHQMGKWAQPETARVDS